MNFWLLTCHMVVESQSEIAVQNSGQIAGDLCLDTTRTVDFSKTVIVHPTVNRL